MNNINLVKHNYKLSTRKYNLTKDKQFKIPSIGLIQSFKILNLNSILEKYKNLQLIPVLIIGNFEITPTLLYNHQDTSIISIKDLRNYIRNIDFPETEIDNKLINFEHYLFSQQLKCTDHYYTIKNNDLYDCIFTSGLNVYIELRDVNNSQNKDIHEQIIDDLDIEETFWEKIYEN